MKEGSEYQLRPQGQMQWVLDDHSACCVHSHYNFPKVKRPTRNLEELFPDEIKVIIQRKWTQWAVVAGVARILPPSAPNCSLSQLQEVLSAEFLQQDLSKDPLPNGTSQPKTGPILLLQFWTGQRVIQSPESPIGLVLQMLHGSACPLLSPLPSPP